MGFMYSKDWDPAKKIPDLTGKVAVVTGANAGIGYATTFQLALHGAKVYLAARNERLAKEAIEKLYSEIPKLEKGKVVWLPLDLSDLNDVSKAAETVCKSETRLDILINNAGLATDSFQTTPNGFEMTIGVNHLGHFLFTINLLPLLKATAAKKDSDVRVVIVSSSAHSSFVPKKLQFDQIDDLKYPGMNSPPTYSGMRNMFSRYGVSKLANILFGKELQQRLDAEDVPIIVTSVNPGPVNTKGGMSVFPAFLRPILSRLWVAPSTGAIPILYLATEPEIRQKPASYKGLYYTTNSKPETPSAAAQDPLLARNLWETSMSATADWVKA